MTTLRTLSVIAVAGLFLTGCSLIGGNGDSETTTAAKTTTAEVTTSTITQTATKAKVTGGTMTGLPAAVDSITVSLGRCPNKLVT